MLTMISTASVFAHALWIETSGEGAIGKAHELKIYYGEYAAKEFEPTDKWYSDVSKFALWLVAPDGTKKQLDYKPGDNHFIASFTPDKNGVYTVTIGHSAKDIDGTMIYQFNASAQINVGKGEPSVKAIENNELYLQPVKDPKGKSGIVKVFYKGKPAAKVTVAVSGPTGWSKNFETDENGVLTFEPLWKGWFALEGFYTSEETGTHFDKPYEQIWRCATVRVQL